MVKGFKVRKDEYTQCTSCLCDNTKNDIYAIKIGKTYRQTTTIKLCYDCLSELGDIADSFDILPYENEE